MYIKPLRKALECHYYSAMLSCFSVFQLFSSATFYPPGLPSEWECIGIHLVDLPVVISLDIYNLIPKHWRNAIKLQNCRSLLARSQTAFQGNSSQIKM